MSVKTSSRGEALWRGSNFLPWQPRCKAVGSVNITSAVWTIWPMTGKYTDTDNMTQIGGANPSRITINTAGMYGIFARGQFPYDAAGLYTALQINKNGAYLDAVGQFAPQVNGGSQIPFAGAYEFVKGDYIEIQGYLYRSGGGGPFNCAAYIDVVYMGPPIVNMVREKSVVSYVTPAQMSALTPIDGDEIYLIVDASNGVVWHLRYNAGSSSAYKWEYLGGPPLLLSAAGAALGATSTWTLTPTPLKITMPRAGDYMATSGAQMNSVTGSDLLSTAFMNGAGLMGSTYPGSMTQRTTGDITVLWFTAKCSGMTAGDYIGVGYNSTNPNNSAQNRSLQVTPVRLG